MGSEGEWDLLHAEEEKPCGRGNSLCKGPVVRVWNVRGQLSECWLERRQGPHDVGACESWQGFGLKLCSVFQQGVFKKVCK